ncbi:MAG: GntR family transcriptional regulator [Lachnospiraceae bacterium]|nr:GntR family transcriptional regulator [Lachnospiraceae bacterium]
MIILIDNTGGVPIYEQIYKQIKAHIINGELKEDDMLPSIRSLAKELRISVITTKRAYEELERDNYIYTVAGKGSYVAKKNLELLREETLRTIEEHLSEVIKLAQISGIDIDELEHMLQVMSQEV